MNFMDYVEHGSPIPEELWVEERRWNELDVTERGGVMGHPSYEVDYECEESNDDYDDGSWT